MNEWMDRMLKCYRQIQQLDRKKYDRYDRLDKEYIDRPLTDTAYVAEKISCNGNTNFVVFAKLRLNQILYYVYIFIYFNKCNIIKRIRCMFVMENSLSYL